MKKLMMVTMAVMVAAMFGVSAMAGEGCPYAEAKSSCSSSCSSPVAASSEAESEQVVRSSERVSDSGPWPYGAHVLAGVPSESSEEWQPAASSERESEQSVKEGEKKACGSDCEKECCAAKKSCCGGCKK